MLPEALRSPNIYFTDAAGRGACQLDFLWTFEGRRIIVECKASWHSYVRQQISGLYLPLVEFMFSPPVVALVVVGECPGREVLERVVREAGGHDLVIVTPSGPKALPLSARLR